MKTTKEELIDFAKFAIQQKGLMMSWNYEKYVDKYLKSINLKPDENQTYEAHLTEEFTDKCNDKLSPMGLQLNPLLTHPQCTKEKCYCGKVPCYYSSLWD